MNVNDKLIGQIFFESAPVVNNVVDVKKASTNTVKLKVVLQDADVPNRNNRIYPKKVIEEALRAPYITEKLATKSLAGEMNHPPAGSGLQRQMNIDMKNVSHFIHEFYWDTKQPNLLMGIVETSANHTGRDFMSMIVDNQMVCSFSLRGGGAVTTKGGYDYVKSPLKIITYDAVHFPSHKTAYMIERLNENTVQDITLNDLNKYISENSNNFGIVLESMECFKDNVNLSIENNKIIIADKKNNVLGYSVMENKLENEYTNILSELRSKY